jgi:putative endopeptidase
VFAHLAGLSVRIPFELDVSPDERDATDYVLHLKQGSLGLPDRDYYLKDDPHFATIRNA